MPSIIFSLPKLEIFILTEAAFWAIPYFGMDFIEDYKTPGQFIDGLLKSRGWNQKILSIISSISQPTINKIITGKKKVDADLAIIFGEVFNEDPEAFLDLQKTYDLAKARITSRPDPNRERRAYLFGDLPIGEMIRRSWLEIDDERNVRQVEIALAKFFGVSSAEEIEFLPHAAKRTAVSTVATPVQLAWIYRVKEIASEMLVAKYTPASARNAVKRLSSLLLSAEEARKVPRILAESGIRFVIVESLASAKIDGVCFWLNDASPVIGLSLRYDRIDNFWFVLRHELEHVLCRHGLSSAMLDAELEGERAGTGHNVMEEERVANEAASDFCVPTKALERFIARKDPFFNTRDILGFANSQQIHPGLVAGQLQHCTGRYDRFRNHLVKIRHIVSPSAIVDGWGDVTPTGI